MYNKLEEHVSVGGVSVSFTTIEITDGLAWSTNPKFPLRFFMSFLKNYHAGDINLFWQDIRKNAEIRVNTWVKEHE